MSSCFNPPQDSVIDLHLFTSRLSDRGDHCTRHPEASTPHLGSHFAGQIPGFDGVGAAIRSLFMAALAIGVVAIAVLVPNRGLLLNVTR